MKRIKRPDWTQLINTSPAFSIAGVDSWFSKNVEPLNSGVKLMTDDEFEAWIQEKYLSAYGPNLTPLEVGCFSAGAYAAWELFNKNTQSASLGVSVKEEDYDDDPTPCCHQHCVGALDSDKACPEIADND